MSNILSTTDMIENTISMENRTIRSKQFKKDYPGYIPCFIRYYDSPCIYRNIIHGDVHFTKFLCIIRKKRNINATTGLMSLIEKERDVTNGRVSSFQVPCNLTIKELADRYLHADGFLYISIMVENVFGSNTVVQTQNGH